MNASIGESMYPGNAPTSLNRNRKRHLVDLKSGHSNTTNLRQLFKVVSVPDLFQLVVVVTNVINPTLVDSVRHVLSRRN